MIINNNTPQVWLQKQIMKGCLVEKQAGTAGVNKSGDLILGDYLIYWLCGEV